MAGVGLDQSPHYYSLSRYYREKAGVGEVGGVGSPGLLQGLNTGVALYDLGKHIV